MFRLIVVFSFLIVFVSCGIDSKVNVAPTLDDIENTNRVAEVDPATVEASAEFIGQDLTVCSSGIVDDYNIFLFTLDLYGNSPAEDNDYYYGVTMDNLADFLYNYSGDFDQCLVLDSQTNEYFYIDFIYLTDLFDNN